MNFSTFRQPLFASIALASVALSGCVVRTRGYYYNRPAVVVSQPTVVVAQPVVAQPVATTVVVAQPVATTVTTNPNSGLNAVTTNTVLLAERVVNFAVDRDVVQLAARPETMRGIQFEAVSGGIQMLDCDVTFENGQRIDLPVRNFIQENTRTRVFDFPGAQRNIARVTLVYRTATAGTGRAVVRIWGVQ